PDGLLAAAGQQPPAPAPAEDYLLQVQREAFPALTALLREPDPRLRLAALDVIESLGPDAAQTAPAVTAALRDCNRFVRWAAARALNRMSPTGAAAAMPGLVRLLADPDLDVDLAAAATLERYGPDARTALPALVANLRDATDAE